MYIALLLFQLFTEYGRLALEDNDNSSKPFQVSVLIHCFFRLIIACMCHYISACMCVCCAL